MLWNWVLFHYFILSYNTLVHLNLKTVFLWALLLRLWLIPFFYHPDLKSQHYHFQFFSQGIVNIFSFLSQNKQNLSYSDTFNYLPATYFFGGIFHQTLNLFLGNSFQAWLNDWGPNKFTPANLPLYIFYLKIPYLLLDLALGWLIYRFYQSKQLLSFWLFNPISLYVIYFQGNFDIMPVFLTFLSFLLAKNNRPVLSYLILGLAISLKIYPILFLPYLVLQNHPKKILDIIPVFISGAFPLLTVLPFLSDPSFLQSFSGSGLTQQIFQTRLFSVPVFPLVYLLSFYFYYRKNDTSTMPNSLFIINLVFFATTTFHPQWLLWFLPFYLPLFFKPKLFSFFTWTSVLLCLVYVLLINDNFLNFGHLVVLNPLFAEQTNLNQVLTLRFSLNPKLFQNILQLVLGLFAFTSLFSYVRKK